ncbi:unnamed protein product [Closterium sp. Naga37s-1]|nr:unnamed protein product [Closterium sp. Naga37s-1]
MVHVEHVPLARPHVVHYVDVHLPWSHSLCACCLSRMLRPAPPITFRISSLASLRKHLQQPVVPTMPPFRLANKPTPPILAYSATVPLSAPPRRFPGNTSGASTGAAAASLAQQYRWKADAAPVVAAEAMMLEWLAEPRVGLLLDFHRCWTLYRMAVSIAAFLVLVARFPRFVTLWRAHLRFPEMAFSVLAFQFGAGQQVQGDCVASLLLQVLGVKGKQQLETSFAARMLPLLPGGRGAHGEAGGEGASRGEGREGKEWREGLGGVEWEEYVRRVGEIAAQGGLAGKQYRCCCSQCSKGESTEGRENEGALEAEAGKQRWHASLIFSDCAGSRDKERVEDAAVEEARNRLAAEKGSVEGSGVQDRGKRAVDSDAPASAPAAPAGAGSGAAASGSGAASGAGLVPVNSNGVVALFTFGAVSKPAGAPGLEGSATTGWKEFPEGDRAAVAANLKDPGEFIGLKTFQVGAFHGGELDSEEMKKEYNVRELNMPYPGPSLAGSPNFIGTLRNNSSGPFFPTLGHRVEEFLRRFAPARLAREGRNGPLARAITSWASCMDLKDRTWTPLALGPFAEGKIKPILRSRTEVEMIVEMIAGVLYPASACDRCRYCISGYQDAVTFSSLAANFAYRPSSALLQCILSLFPPRSARFRSFLESLHVAPIPAVVPDSLVAPLLEGVMEELRVLFLFCGIKLIVEERGVTSILQPVGQDGVGQEERLGRQGRWEGIEEWRMWEEVDSWRRAAVMAWPAVEGLGEAGVAGGEGDGLEECCAAMKRVLQEEKVMAEARRQAAQVDAVAASAAAAAAASDQGRSGKGGRRVCSWAQCVGVEGAGLQLKLCSRCGKAAYCSRECQKAHWPLHKITCQPKAKKREESS